MLPPPTRGTIILLPWQLLWFASRQSDTLRRRQQAVDSCAVQLNSCACGWISFGSCILCVDRQRVLCSHKVSINRLLAVSRSLISLELRTRSRFSAARRNLMNPFSFFCCCCWCWLNDMRNSKSDKPNHRDFEIIALIFFLRTNFSKLRAVPSPSSLLPRAPMPFSSTQGFPGHRVLSSLLQCQRTQARPSESGKAY